MKLFVFRHVDEEASGFMPLYVMSESVDEAKAVVSDWAIGSQVPANGWELASVHESNVVVHD